MEKDLNFQNDNNVELDNLFFEADNLIKDNLIGDAYNKLMSIIQKNPRYGRAYNHLGWLFETKYKDLNKAEEYYQKALEYSPEYIPIYLNYAICLSTMGKFDKLKEFLDKAILVEGVSKAQLYNEYGIMYEMQGDFEKAISYYQLAINQSLSNNDINIYQESIERCIRKRGR
jgi:tetratricopeptide (TPR) repeat protein